MQVDPNKKPPLFFVPSTKPAPISDKETSPPVPSALSNIELSLRRTGFQAEYFRSFSSYLLKNINNESIKEDLEPEDKISGILECLPDAIKLNKKQCAEYLLEILKTIPTHKEKFKIASAVLMIDRDIFINDYLVPSLNETLSTNFNIMNNNNNFVKSLFTTLERKKLEAILKEIDYSRMKNIREFANSLSTIVRRDQLFFDTYNKILKSDSSYIKRKTAQIILITMMEKINKSSRLVPFEQAKRLYLNGIAENGELEEIFKILKDVREVGLGRKVKFLLDLAKQETTDAELQSKQFHALIHYAKLLGTNSIRGLAKFILSSNDSRLISLASSLLVTDFESHETCEKGKNALCETIYKQIQSGEKSFALAFVCQMIFIDNSINYNNVFFNLLKRKYPPERGLKEAFEKLRDEPFEVIKKCEIDNRLYFSTDVEAFDYGIVKLFNKLGLNTFIKLILESKNETLKENFIDLVSYSYEVEPKVMDSVMVKTMAASNKAVKEFLLSLVGMSKLGKRSL